MKAFVVEKYGKTSELTLTDVPEPEMRDDDILVQIHAAGVNVLDGKIKDGEFKIILPYRLPLILGNDLAGTVVKVGAHVRRFKVGDEVYARPDQKRIGSFAERIALNERDAALKPASLSMEEAASVPLVGLTAWQALVEIGQIRPGDRVFIQAGSGGVGTFAVQLAKHFGAEVATTASTANFELLRQLGADVLIDYRTQDFEQQLKNYDFVLHSQGTAELEKSLRILKPGGQLISISGPPDPAFAKRANLPLPVRGAISLLSRRARHQAKRRGVNYTFLFMRAEGQQLEKISGLIDSGVIRPIVEKVFPFAETPEALAHVESGRARGKIVVQGSS
ncbi:NADP-dependent oxidoreductase [Deinococcus ruber]|uniref:NADPH:quinone oxidoreductase n=1 Tax=Deinococcus ruber TaxID=1848197 RepID=A0A918CG66_9DEIO|nr:NADP-dependent oxidoreductase [Deinococcus ruber]GGR22243.1 NADPH:quinone oxidoreductase [Deinococcus ruber]